MSDTRVAVVTGVGAGSLGEATARALRRPRLPGAHLDPQLRDHDRHPCARADLPRSVEEFAAWVAADTDRLDVLVNNAGVHLDLRSAWHEPHLVDGKEVHWRTNYLGTAQLTRLLVPLLLPPPTPTARRGWSTWSRSCTPAAATTGWTATCRPTTPGRRTAPRSWPWSTRPREIERRYGARGLHGYSVHPGAVHTNIADRGLETAPILGRLRKLAAPLERRTLKAPDEGARTTVFCATSPLAQPGRLPPLLGAEHALGGGPGRGGRPDPLG